MRTNQAQQSKMFACDDAVAFGTCKRLYYRRKNSTKKIKK